MPERIDMTPKHLKNYINEDARIFAINAKLRISNIIKEKKWSLEAINSATGIPLSSLYRWLDTNDTSFMPFPVLAILAKTLNVSPVFLIDDPDWIKTDDGRYEYIKPLLNEPIENIKIISDYYFKLKSSFELN